jgi:hypothetical protein
MLTLSLFGVAIVVALAVRQTKLKLWLLLLLLLLLVLRNMHCGSNAPVEPHDTAPLNPHAPVTPHDAICPHPEIGCTEPGVLPDAGPGELQDKAPIKALDIQDSICPHPEIGCTEPTGVDAGSL